MAAVGSALGPLLAPHLRLTLERDVMLAMMLDPDADGESSDDSDDESPTGERAGAPGSSLQRAEPSRSGGPRRVQFKAAASTPSSPNADSPPQHSFEHEEPPLPATSATPSLLTAQLEQSGSVGGGASAAASGPPMRLRVFGELHNVASIDVPADSTFMRVVALLLAELKLPGLPSSYELLMADPEGDVDDDIIPPRDKPVADFGKDFYLRKAAKSLAAAQAKTEEASDAAAAAGAAGAGGAADAPASGTAPRMGLMRVRLPREAFGQRLGQWVITQPYKGDLHLAELMYEICKLQRVRLHPERHVFALPLETHGAGGSRAVGEPLAMTQRLADIELPRNDAGEPEIAVLPKHYADQPPPRGAAHSLASQGGSGHHVRFGGVQGGGGSGGWRGGGDSMGGGGSLTMTLEPVFSNQTAILYKEYAVVKVNKRGVRQTRVLGIDNKKFRNFAPANAREDERAPKSFRDRGLKFLGLRQMESGTRRAFFPMADLLEARLVGPDAPHDFTVIFRWQEGSHGAHGASHGMHAVLTGSSHVDHKMYHFEAETPQEAAEIVGKLTHILSLQDQAAATPPGVGGGGVAVGGGAASATMQARAISTFRR